MEDHQVEIIDVDEDDTNISPSDDLPTNMKSEKSLLGKNFSSVSKGREREQSKQLKSSSLKILLSWVSRGRIIWW